MTVRKLKAPGTQKEVNAPQSSAWPRTAQRGGLKQISGSTFFYIGFPQNTKDTILLNLFILRYFRSHRSSSSTEMYLTCSSPRV